MFSLYYIVQKLISYKIPAKFYTYLNTLFCFINKVNTLRIASDDGLKDAK